VVLSGTIQLANTTMMPVMRNMMAERKLEQQKPSAMQLETVSQRWPGRSTRGQVLTGCQAELCPPERLGHLANDPVN
jgi:hypothetical protein